MPELRRNFYDRSILSSMSYSGKSSILLGKCRYTPATATLERDGKEVTPCLTPTEATVLEFLYKNNDRTVTREELLRHAVGKRVVGADIVTQYIRVLRKALGDSANKPTYIRTYQKTGYRFIAPVEEDVVSFWNQKGFKLGLLVSILLIALIVSLYILYPTTLQDENRLPVSLTSLKGQEMYGDVSPDGNFLVFSHKPQGKSNWDLVLKKMDEESYFQLLGDVVQDVAAKFSPSGNQLIYYHYNQDVNQIRLAQINWKEKRLQNIEVLLDFPLLFNSINLGWQNEQTIYFSSKELIDQPYQISSFNLKSKERNIITDPPTNGHGDMAVSYSVMAGKWAILRNVGWSKTEVLIYDPKSEQLSKLASLPLLLYTIAWNHDGSGLVLRTGKGKLGLLSLADGQIKTILETNYPIYAPFRLGGNSIGFMRGDLVVSDILQYSLTQDSQATPIISSSYKDSYPVYAQQAKLLAFKSTRSGHSQIWIKNQQGQLSQISHFKESPKIRHLSIDKFGKYVAFIANAELHLMEISSGKVLFSSGAGNSEHNNPVFSEDGSSLIYTVKREDEWFLEKRHLDNMKIRTPLTEGYIAKPCAEMDCLYVIKRNRSRLYKRMPNGQIVDTGIDLGNIQFAHQFHVTQDSIYFADKIDNQMMLIRYDIKAQTRVHITKIPSTNFSLNRDEKLVYWRIRTPNETNLESITLK